MIRKGGQQVVLRLGTTVQKSRDQKRGQQVVLRLGTTVQKSGDQVSTVVQARLFCT